MTRHMDGRNPNPSRKRSMNFRSYDARRKWLAHGHMRTKTGLLVRGKKGRKSVFETTPGNTKTFVRGKLVPAKH